MLTINIHPLRVVSRIIFVDTIIRMLYGWVIYTQFFIGIF